MSTLPVIVMAAAMMVVGAGFVYYLVRQNPGGRPRGALQWAATSLATLLVITSGVLLVLAAVVGAGGGSMMTPTDAARPQGTAVGTPAPELAFRTIEEGRQRQLDEYRGQVVLLNFWATWCAPCLRELPELAELQKTYREQGLVVLALSDEDPETLRAFVGDRPLGVDSGYLPDRAAVPQPFARTLAIRPTTYVIDREGMVREFVKGARSYDFFERSITPYL